MTYGLVRVISWKCAGSQIITRAVYPLVYSCIQCECDGVSVSVGWHHMMDGLVRVISWKCASSQIKTSAVWSCSSTLKNGFNVFHALCLSSLLIQAGRATLGPFFLQIDLLDTNMLRNEITINPYIFFSSNPDIKLTGDCPSLNISGMMPALDIPIWVEGKKVRHQHYRKPMANGLVMMRFSAMPEKIKRTSLTQEGIHILRNTSLELPPEVAAGHLTQLCIRMKAAGYNEQFRLEVIKSSMAGFNKMVEVEKEGGRPINRPRSWEEDRRQVQKESRQLNWFRAGGHHVPVFVPHTPGSELARRMRAKEEENNQGRKVRFLIVE